MSRELRRWFRNGSVRTGNFAGRHALRAGLSTRVAYAATVVVAAAAVGAGLSLAAGCRRPDVYPLGLAPGEPSDAAATAKARRPEIRSLRLEPAPESAPPPPGLGDGPLLPEDVAAALRGEEFFWGGLMKWMRPNAPEWGALPIDPPATTIADTDGLFRAIFNAALVPDPSRWVAYRFGAPGEDRAWDGRGLVAAPITARMAIGDEASEVKLTGRAWRVTGAIGFVLHVDPPLTDADLETAFPVSFTKWLPGTLGIGEVTHRPLGGGAEWRHWTPDPDGRPAWIRTNIWPMSVLSWSNGEWLMVAVSPAWGWGMETPRIHTVPNFLKPNVPRVSLQRVRELDELFHKRAPFSGVTGPTADMFRVEVISSLPPNDDLIGPINAHTRGMERDWLKLLAPDDWAAGSLAPLPAKALRYLNVPEGTTTWQVHLTGHPVFGDATAGLMILSTDPERWTHLVQWVIGPEKFALTVAERNGPVRYEEPGRGLSGDGGHTALTHAGKDLPLFLGEYGWRLALSPMDIRTDVCGNGVLLTPKPDTPFGVLGEERVGDQPWAHCKVFHDEAVKHIVFDLPKEE